MILFVIVFMVTKMKLLNFGTLVFVMSSLSYADDNLTNKINQQNDVMKKIEEKEAQTKENSEGYSFFKTAMQHISYEERHVYQKDHPEKGINKGDVQKNDFSGTNLVTIGGNISPINDKYDFSFETVSTIVPQEIEEKWTIGDRVNQTDKATLDFTQITFLLHQKYTPQHRAVAGLEFKKMEFERYDFVSVLNGATSLNNIRERTSSVSLDAGYWYESGNVGKKGWHYSARGLVKVPVWQDAINTASPEISFSDPSGYDLNMEVSASYSILPNIDVGVILGYDYIFRNGESKGSIHWPENTFSAYTLGVSLLWNL